jgi:hypothetical protein
MAVRAQNWIQYHCSLSLQDLCLTKRGSSDYLRSFIEVLDWSFDLSKEDFFIGKTTFLMEKLIIRFWSDKIIAFNCLFNHSISRNLIREADFQLIGQEPERRLFDVVQELPQNAVSGVN